MKNLNSIDVSITFDTTGSMYPCLTQVRRYIREVINRLFKDIPDLRISIIAHGDYCDASRYYVTKILDFSTDVTQIENFVNNVGPTHGGDFPECYELVLHEARTELSWQSGRSKVIVMIGDAIPHGPEYSMNTKKIDWRNELGLLLEAGINVYGVHAMPGIRSMSKPFYEEIAKKTGGFYLTLDQFSYVSDLIMGICYKQDSEEKFVSFVSDLNSNGKMTRGLKDSFRVMADKPTGDFVESFESVFGSDDTIYTFEKDGLNPVPSGRFQVMEVTDESRIDHFIKEQGVTFKRGRAFYELVRFGKKRYKVQPYKEIILMDRESGDFFTGKECRELLGLDKWKPRSECSGGEYQSLSPKSIDRYRVFIQSTSNTRKLVPGSSLLYEIEDWER